MSDNCNSHRVYRPFADTAWAQDKAGLMDQFV
jgi:hypothetical protein